MRFGLRSLAGALLALALPARAELPAVQLLGADTAAIADVRLSETRGPAPALTPGERAVRGVRLERRGPPTDALREGVVAFSGLPAGRHWGVLVRTQVDGWPLSGFEARAHLEPDGRLLAPVPLPFRLTGPVEAFAVDTTASVERLTAPILMEDPLDADPIGDRWPLIFIPGKSNQNDQTADHYEEGKILVWREIRAHPGYAQLRRRYKPYIYMYPTYRSFADSAADLVRLVREHCGDLSTRHVALVAQSLGGPVARHAMTTDHFGDRVCRIITISSPHHGTVGASLRYANERISERLGPIYTLVLRFGQAIEPDTPCLRDLAWDGYDGGITAADQQRYGVLLNATVAQYNATWPYDDRLVCLASDITGNLLGHGMAWGVPQELYRRGVAAWLPRYGNADPIVPHGSATDEGHALLERIELTNVDHEQLIFHPRVVAAVYRHLTEAALHPAGPR